MNRYSTALLALAGLSGACSTELTSTRIVEPGSIPLAGAPYNLPYTRFKIKVIRRVASCYDKPATQPGEPDQAPAIRVKVQATAVAEQRRDPLRNYVLDLGSLQGAFKSTDVQIAYYDTGAIKSINASAEERTGEFVASLAQTAARLVGVPASLPAGALSPQATKPVERCSAAVAQAVHDLPEKEAKLAALAAEIIRQTDNLKQYLTLAVSMGRALPAADRATVARQVADLVALQKESAALQGQVEAMLARVSVEDNVTWPNDGETFVSPAPVVGALDLKVIEKWTANDNAQGASFQGETAVYFALKPSEAIGRSAACTKDCADEKVNGLKYRMPAAGNLLMCSALTDATPSQPRSCAAGTTVAQDEMISQLGPIFTLPLRSAVFTNKAIVATFSENGVPTLLGTKASAAADKAAATVGSVADASLAAAASRAGREAVELEAKIKVLTLRKQLEVANQALAPAPADAKKQATDGFTTDTALLNAELANLAAKQALDEARQRLPAS